MAYRVWRIANSKWQTAICHTLFAIRYAPFDFFPRCLYPCGVAKKRLDILLIERELAETRHRAQALILAGDVRVDAQVISKAGALVAEDAAIAIRAPLKYVSRGGFKLEGALDAFALDARDKTYADIGASTGGFTDCLLQRGAARVYAIDVGYGQLAWKLRNDPRVVVMDRVNIRYLDALAEPIDLAVIDVSFISLTLVLPVAKRLLQPRGNVVALVKPQFEAGRAQVGKGGIVRDARVHRAVLEKIAQYAIANDWRVRGVCRSPITGADGNVEFFIHLSADRASENVGIATILARVLEPSQG